MQNFWRKRCDKSNRNYLHEHHQENNVYVITNVLALKAFENSAVTEINNPGIDLTEYSKQDDRDSVTGTVWIIKLDTIKPSVFVNFVKQLSNPMNIVCICAVGMLSLKVTS